MAARYEVRMNINVIGFKIANSEQEASDSFFFEIENLLKGYGQPKLSDDTDIVEVELEDSEAESA